MTCMDCKQGILVMQPNNMKGNTVARLLWLDWAVKQKHCLVHTLTDHQTDTGNTPACKGVGAALSCVRVKSGVPVVIIRYEDGASRAVGNVRACLALAPVISRMEAVCLLLTFAADVVVVLLSWLATPVHSFNRVDQRQVIEGKGWGSGVGCSGVGQAKECAEGGDREQHNL